MTATLQARGAAIGAAIAARAKDRAIARGVERLRDDVAGIEVRGEPDAIVLTGRGLFRRWINDARLRAIGSLLT